MRYHLFLLPAPFVNFWSHQRGRLSTYLQPTYRNLPILPSLLDNDIWLVIHFFGFCLSGPFPMLRAPTFPSKLSSPFDFRSPSLSPRPMCVIVAVFIVSHVVSSVLRVNPPWRYSRVVGERCLQVLGQPLEVVPKFLELAVGHRHDVRKGERGVEQGSVLRAAVTAWRRAACHNPQEMIRDEMSLTSSSTSLRRRADPTQPLLIPAWRTSRACSFARVDGGWYSARKRKREGEKREREN